MVAIGVGVVGADQVHRVGGHLVHPAPVVREELVHGGEDALVGQLAGVVVHGLVLGLHVVPEGVGGIAPGLGLARAVGRMQQLPGGRGPVGAVTGQDLVEDRRARSGHPDDEDGGGHGLVQDLGPVRPEGLQLQPVAQRAQDLGPSHHAADHVQVALGLEGGEQHLVVRPPGRRPEVVQPGRRHRRGDQLLGIEPDQVPRPADGITVRVEPLHPHRPDRRHPRHQDRPPSVLGAAMRAPARTCAPRTESHAVSRATRGDHPRFWRLPCAPQRASEPPERMGGRRRVTGSGPGRRGGGRRAARSARPG